MDIFDFLILIIKVIDSYLVPLIFAVAFLVFLYGVFKYFIAGAGEEEKRKEGRKYALYGIIGFVIIIAIWGIVNLLISSLGFDTKSRPPIPTFGGSSTAPSNTTNPLPTNTTNTNNSTGSGSGYGPNDCRSDGLCPGNSTCAYSGPQAGSCITNSPNDCRVGNNQCPSGYICNNSTGLCNLNSI